jgi:hypothetical protein
VEEELARLQQKSATLNTVEARHEKARMPDAPGVARKMERNAKVGHPPKRNHAESSSKLATVPEKEEKKSLVVKIPYKKRTAIHIQRILALTQKPRGQMEKLQAGERRARERSTSAAPPTQDESESEDLPLSKSKTSAPVSTTGSKKRPFDSVDPHVGNKNPNRSRTENDADTRSEPTAKRSKLHNHNHSDAVSDAAKRSKLPDPNRSNATSDSIERNVEKKNLKRANNLDASDLRSEAGAKRSKLEIDVAKAATPVAPAFKSPSNPATATTSQKSLLATPKKGDALKSVAMRRADSNENLARTPQTTSASTPASTEKHRPNGGDMRPSTDRPSEVKAPMIEKLKADDAKLYPLGTILKRKMDSIVNPRKRDTSAPASDLELKAGFCIGVESLMAYMLAFEARDRVASIRSLPRDPSVWEGFIGLQEFLFKTAKPYAELHALIEVMGGVAREMLNNAYMDHAGLVKDRDGAQKIIGKMKENCRAREMAWRGASQNETVLNDLGVMNDKQHRLGIWSGVEEAVAFAAETLALYAARENLDWTPEPGLARD